MDSHANPWSLQQQQQQQQTQFLEDEDDNTTAASSPFHSRRSHDRKHYSFASSITLASDSFHDDFFSLRKSTPSTTTDTFDSSDRNLQQQQQQSSHVRTWSQEDTITSASDYGEDDKHHYRHRHHHNNNTCNIQRHSGNDEVLEALLLADNTLELTLSPSSTGNSLSLPASSSSEVILHTHTDLAVERTLSDSGIGVEVCLYSVIAMHHDKHNVHLLSFTCFSCFLSLSPQANTILNSSHSPRSIYIPTARWLGSKGKRRETRLG